MVATSNPIYKNYLIKHRSRVNCYDVYAPHSDFIAQATGFQTVEEAQVWIDNDLNRIKAENEDEGEWG